MTRLPRAFARSAVSLSRCFSRRLRSCFGLAGWNSNFLISANALGKSSAWFKTGHFWVTLRTVSDLALWGQVLQALLFKVWEGAR